MFYQMAKRRNLRRNPKLVAIGALLAVAVTFIGVFAEERIIAAVVAENDKAESLAAEQKYQAAEKGAAVLEKLRLLEQQNLELRLENAQISASQRTEIMQRLGRLDLEQRLEEGTASISEQIAEIRKQEKHHQVLMETWGGTSIGGVDKVYRSDNS